MTIAPIAVRQRATALIQNSNTTWAEQDRPLLEAMPEAALIRLESEAQHKVTVVPDKPRTFEQMLAEADPEIRESHQEALENITERKQAAIATLLANKHCDFTEEELRSMTAKRLEKMVAMASPEPDEPQETSSFAGRGLPHIRRHVPDEEQAPPAPATFAKVVERQKAMGKLVG